MMYVPFIVAGLMLAAPIRAQQQNILVEQAGVFPDAAPTAEWTIEDGKIVHKDGAGTATELTWTNPPVELDEQGFTLTMAISASTNSKAGMRVSGDLIADPPQARSIATNVEAGRARASETA
jgi:hypothetical protein